MSAGDGFLARWSRRKREAVQGATPVDDGADAPTFDPAEASGAGTDDGGTAETATLTPEEIAALPRVEDITAETDIAQFLRAGVPTLLRKAALRRMWAADPAIRDFVGEARDYSWDWNTLGGVPGSGPLLPTDDVQATLRSMFGPQSSSEDEDAILVAEDEEGKTVLTERPDPPEATAAVEIDPLSNPVAAAADEAGEASVAQPTTDASTRAKEPPRGSRRHGGAIPTL